MWDNPRLLNIAAGALVGIAALLFAFAGFVLLLRSQFFPVTQVDIARPLGKTTREEIEAVLGTAIRGNFFALDAEQLRAALEALPWVRRASVRRRWPDRLEVSIEEHVPLSRWRDEALLNTYGERFNGASDEPLPRFIGPSGSEQELARRYARFTALVAPLGAVVEELVLTPRYAWQLRLAGGLELVLGREGDGAEARLAKFVAAYPSTLGTIGRAHGYVDLRYPNGFALRLAQPKG